MHESDHLLSGDTGDVGNALPITPNLVIPFSEIHWRFSRSSGPGGQNVNKTATRVTLSFNVDDSPSLTDPQKRMIHSRLKKRIDTNGNLNVVVEDERSQHRNRQIALERFQRHLRKALKPAKQRKKTSVPQSEREERLRDKRTRARIKAARQRGRQLLDDE